MFSINSCIHLDVFTMTCVKNEIVLKLKKTQQKHLVFEDNSDARRKVLIVRKTLWQGQFLVNYAVCYVIVSQR